MRAAVVAALLLAGACASPPDSFRLRGPMMQGGYALGRTPRGTVDIALDGRAVPVAPDRRFLVGFGRDAPSVVTLEATLKSGARVRRVIPVAPRLWPVEHLPTLAPPAVAAADPLAAALRSAELVRIRIARALSLDRDGWRTAFRWPALGRISGVFGAQRVLGGTPADPHSGVDVARAEGWPVYAPAAGTVTLASPPAFSLEGNLVILDHGMGLSSAFLHLSRVDVRVGDRVEQGQRIGSVGATGRTTGPHLHWGMVWTGVRIDPVLWAGPMPR